MDSDALALIYDAAPRARIELFAPLLNAAMGEFSIDSNKRQAAFLAQIGYESGQLRYTEEIASGEKYENRDDLGNDQTGDGVRFKGRGLMQITGRRNYRACSIGLGLGLQLLADPAQLATAYLATRSAAWFWRTNGLNAYADDNRFGSLTKRINGGYNGLDERIQLWIAARRVLDVND